jgi:hypothetical protein
MTASNYTAANQNRVDVYFGYSDDEGSTWRYANGTALDDLFGNETGKIATQGTNTSSSDAILDENDKPIVMVGYCDGCSSGNTFAQIAQYDAAIGTSGSWTLTNVTQNSMEVITSDRANDLGNLFLDTDNGRPTFYVPTLENSNWYMRRYNRQSGQTTIFDVKYEDDSVSLSTQSQTVTVWDAPDRLFEVYACVKTVTYCTAWTYGEITSSTSSWTSGTITMTAGSRLLNTTITHTVDSNSFINKVEWLEGGTVTATYDLDMVSGTSTNITQSDADLIDVDSDFTIKVYLTSNSTGTPIITQIEGYYELLNSAPSIDNCPIDNFELYRGQQIDYEFTGTDTDGDTLTWSLSVIPIVDGEWLSIGSSTGILDGSFGKIGSYDFTVTVEDPSLATDTCAITIDIIAIPEDPIIHPPLPPYDFECRQLNGRELNCWITETGGIPWDRLNFDWEIEGENHKGWNIIHKFDNEFTMGEETRVILTLSYVSNPDISKDISKSYKSSYISLWWIVLGFLLMIFIFIIIMLIVKEDKKRISVPRTKNKRPSKLSALIKTFGWTGVLLLGIAFIWLPTGTPDDAVTTLPLILILGFSLWLIIGVIIILACLFLCGRKLVKILKYGL